MEGEAREFHSALEGGKNVSLRDKGVTMATTQLWRRGERSGAAKE